MLFSCVLPTAKLLENREWIAILILVCGDVELLPYTGVSFSLIGGASEGGICVMHAT